MALTESVPGSNPAFEKEYDKDYAEIPEISDPTYLIIREDDGYETPVKPGSPRSYQNLRHDRYHGEFPNIQPTVAGSGQPVQQSQFMVAGSGQPVQPSRFTVAGSGQPLKETNFMVAGIGQPVTQTESTKAGSGHNKWRCIAVVLVVLCLLLVVGTLLAYFLPKELNKDNSEDQPTPQGRTGGCNAQWLKRDGMQSDGGLAIVSQSVEDCQSFCENMFECLAIDKHKEENLCWLHTQEDSIIGRKRNENINQYVLETRCNQYQGNLCSVMSPCQNGATCEGRVGGQYSCVCPRHCSGVHCETCGCPIDFLTGTVTSLKVMNGTAEKTIQVYLETDPIGDTWIVLMRRNNGSVDFVNRTWNDYKEGFGSPEGEFWLGNDNIHSLTSNGSEYVVRFDMRAWTGECRHAQYTSFSVDGESDKYRLHIGGYSGTAGDSLTAGFQDDYKNHDNNMFSTYDADNDDDDDGSCARDHKGGWWYTRCFYAKLTGVYGRDVKDEQGISWEAWLGQYNYLQYADMKVKVKL